MPPLRLIPPDVDLPQQVDDAIGSRQLLARGESLLLAVSGGLDSMVLLELLCRLAPRRGWSLTAAHFNHQLRGTESDADEIFVHNRAAALQIPFVSARGDVRGLAQRERLSIEMAARRLRHGFLAEAAKTSGATAILLAHHADDQVETFWLQLLRGGAGQALTAMRWTSPSPPAPEIRLVRPLLATRRSVLQDFAAREGIPFREDSSNAREDILRNKIRRRLLPLLQREYQPALFQTTLRQIQILGDEKDFAAAAARDWLAAGKLPFGELHPALRRGILREQLLRLRVPPAPELIEALLASSAPVSVAPGRRVSRGANGRLQVEPIASRDHRPGSLTLELGSEGQAQWEGLQINWRIGSSPIHAEDAETFDAEKIGGRVILRFWQPGDRFQPIGLGGSAKLQDLFTNLKLPAEARRRAALALNEHGQIFWVEHLRVGEIAKVTPATRRFLHWRWSRPPIPASD